MRKIHFFAIALLVGVLFLDAPLGKTQDTNLSPDMDGKTWMASTSAEKRAFLYGVGSTCVLEYHIRTKYNEEPSSFVRGWVEVFKDRSWPEIEKSLDQYYADNPAKVNENVFHVIWNQMIKPKLKD